MDQKKVNPIQVQKFLKGMHYPAKKEDIVNKAKELGASEEITFALEKLPEQDYNTPAEVSRQISQINAGIK
ncbi:DUF2795 domain-containing protein [Candidatus Microgenomates bacterium]|nr:MAG: DUF2795 domain-containing protein [Candidatus Microgenomates bacterium]